MQGAAQIHGFFKGLPPFSNAVVAVDGDPYRHLGIKHRTGCDVAVRTRERQGTLLGIAAFAAARATADIQKVRETGEMGGMLQGIRCHELYNPVNTAWLSSSCNVA